MKEVDVRIEVDPELICGDDSELLYTSFFNAYYESLNDSILIDMYEDEVDNFDNELQVL